MTKFGVSLRDEVTLTISQERFEDFISPFLDQESDAEIEVTMRPREEISFTSHLVQDYLK